MAASMMSLPRMTSRLKPLFSLGVRRNHAYAISYFCNRYNTDHMNCKYALSHRLFGSYVRGLYQAETDRTGVLDKMSENISASLNLECKECVTSKTLTVILPNLSRKTTQEQVKALFSRHGVVKNVNLKQKSIQAQVLMQEKTDAVKMRNMNRMNFHDRQIEFSKPSIEGDDKILSRTVMISNLDPSTSKEEIMKFLNNFPIEQCTFLHSGSDKGYIKFETVEQAEMFLMQISQDFNVNGKPVKYSIQPEHPNRIYLEKLDRDTTVEDLAIACRNHVQITEMPKCWRPEEIRDMNTLLGTITIEFKSKRSAQMFFEESLDSLELNELPLEARILEVKTVLQTEAELKEAERQEHEVSHKFSYVRAGLPYVSRVLVQPDDMTDLYIEADGKTLKEAREESVKKAKHFWTQIEPPADMDSESTCSLTRDDLVSVFEDASQISLTEDEEGKRFGHIVFMKKLGSKTENLTEAR